ncbi:50S ribosomal protein L18Ae [Natronorubrum daqingense]|uniref:Large ribosomal subunit protein eL20 n=1 Tax=Natronorubrum daqingense TaxID=588898 RepID=A0A1N7FU12_9EURY|nr:50S ribosomal protein L18Ae [Natronorubrum daqingense]APX97420.1 50S ribosomal protein L18a [Natronorubrum daqingense]SIS03725.1 large subunit ribosomal protein LX [Natronorubrum daqingense]
MNQYTVTGRFKNRDGYSSFETTIDAVNESVAREHALSQFGSEHGLKRTEIDLEEVAQR